MKFLHLSDLHIGKRVNGFSMIEDQKYILKKIVNIIDDEKPDAILVAGDVYDRNVPGEDAMKVWDQFLVDISKRNIPLYAISGNHDSAVRFADHGNLVANSGIFLSPVYDGKANHFVLEDEFGPINIYLLPFIKPAIVKALFEDEKIENYTDACRVAIKKMNVDINERNILLAHQFVTGAKRSESEEVVVGGLDNVDATVFKDFDYVALGHIHGKQKIERESIRYCGTPLKYSFSEKDHTKSVTILEMMEKGNINIREAILVPYHDMREIKGSYEEIMLKENYENTQVEDYIHVVLTDENDIVDAAAKIRKVYPNLMKISYDNKRTRSNQTIEEIEKIDEKSPLELFEKFYEMQNNQEMTSQQRDYVLEQIKDIWEVDL